MTNIVFLDLKTIGKVDNLKLLAKLGKLETYESTEPEQVVERSKGKEIVIVNKVEMTEEVMKQLPDLKLICVAATGVNNVDLNYAENNGISVKNVAGYSTDSVAQLTFTMLLYLINKPYYYDTYVKSGAYSRSGSFTHHNEPFWELKGKRLGIIGLGTIGRQVARIAESFGMEVVFYSTTGRNNHISYKRFELDDLLKHLQDKGIKTDKNYLGLIRDSNLANIDMLKALFARKVADFIDEGCSGEEALKKLDEYHQNLLADSSSFG